MPGPAWGAAADAAAMIHAFQQNAEEHARLAAAAGNHESWQRCAVAAAAAAPPAPPNLNPKRLHSPTHPPTAAPHPQVPPGSAG